MTDPLEKYRNPSRMKWGVLVAGLVLLAIGCATVYIGIKYGIIEQTISVFWAHKGGGQRLTPTETGWIMIVFGATFAGAGTYFLIFRSRREKPLRRLGECENL